jgi:hypothetical protein
MIEKFVSNNYKSEGFGIQRSKDDLPWVLGESSKIFTLSSGVFTQSLNLLVQFIDVLP